MYKGEEEKKKWKKSHRGLLGFCDFMRYLPFEKKFSVGIIEELIREKIKTIDEKRKSFLSSIYHIL